MTDTPETISPASAPPLKQESASCAGCSRRWTGRSRCHCSGCHETFTAITAFDMHRRGSRCVLPEAAGLEARPDGMWRHPGERPAVAE